METLSDGNPFAFQFLIYKNIVMMKKEIIHSYLNIIENPS